MTHRCRWVVVPEALYLTAHSADAVLSPTLEAAGKAPLRERLNSGLQLAVLLAHQRCVAPPLPPPPPPPPPTTHTHTHTHTCCTHQPTHGLGLCVRTNNMESTCKGATLHKV